MAIPRIWWENQAHTIVTGYLGDAAYATGHGPNELNALWDLWCLLGDIAETSDLREHVAAVYRSLSGGRDPVFVEDVAPPANRLKQPLSTKRGRSKSYRQ